MSQIILNGCKSIEIITIPEGNIKIEDSSFEGLSTLKKVNIPSTIQIIGKCSFKNCSSLYEIDNLESIISFEESSFEGCSSLKEITISKSVNEIGTSSFRNCYSLERIIFSELSKIDKFENSIFAGCSNLFEIINIPKLISIRQNCFDNCNSLNQIHLPSTLVNIEDNSFNKCSSLTELTIPNSVEHIGKNSFNNCSSLIKVIFNSSLITKFEESTFINCISLKELINIPNIDSIENNCFEGCKLLSKITLPLSLKEIGDNAFKNCSSLKEIQLPDNLISIGKACFFGCSSIEEIKLPPNLTEIKSITFGNCTSLSKFEIPKSVTEIDNSSFYGCCSIQKIQIPSVEQINQRPIKKCSVDFNNIDKYQTIVFELSSSFCRVGFAGQFNPILIFPTILTKVKNYVITEEKKTEETKPRIGNNALDCLTLYDTYCPIEQNGIINIDEIELIFQYAFDCIGVDIKKYNILIIDSPFHYLDNREKIAKLLFEKFQVPALFFGNKGNFALMSIEESKKSLKIPKIILDIENNSTSFIPIYMPLPLYDHIEKYDVGITNIANKLQKSINKNLNYIDLQNIMNSCYVSNNGDKENVQFDNGIDIKMEKELYECTEILFEKGIHKNIFETIKKIYPTFQNQLPDIIYLVGDMANLKGLRERLENEINKLIVADNFFDEFKVKIIPDADIIAWRFASKCGNCQGFSNFFIKRYENINYRFAINKKCF